MPEKIKGDEDDMNWLISNLTKIEKTKNYRKLLQKSAKALKDYPDNIACLAFYSVAALNLGLLPKAKKHNKSDIITKTIFTPI